MGLPMWRDPDEKKSTTSSAKREDPTACARSPIRRRPVPTSRPTRPQLPRDLSARLDRSSSLLSGSMDLLNSRSRALSAEEVSSQASTLSSEDTLVEVLRVTDQDLLSQDLGYTVRSGDNDGDTNHLDQTNAVTESFPMLPMDDISPWGYSASAAAPMSRSRSQRPRPRHDPGSLNAATARRTVRLGSASETLHNREVNLLGIPIIQPATRRSHPLSHSWRPGSPIDGLGDRDRSPTLTDAWEVIRTTITPDETLPSADSSFTSAAASQSFNAGNGSGISTSSSSNESRNTSGNDSRSTSFSSVESDDLICVEDEALRASSVFARAMFRLESNTPAGLRRIDAHLVNHNREGNQFAFANESMIIDIGFRLIDEALESTAGHIRLDEVRRAVPGSSVSLDQVIRSMGELHRIHRSNNESSPSSATSDHENTDAHLHDEVRHRARSERQGSHAPNQATLPVIETDSDDDIPYSRVREREASESLLTGDIQDLESMRRVIERFAARDDVPDEWWMSMGLNPVGLNISSTQPRQRRSPIPEGPAAGSRTSTRTRERDP